jgi:hypothetical protein
LKNVFLPLLLSLTSSCASFAGKFDRPVSPAQAQRAELAFTLELRQESPRAARSLPLLANPSPELKAQHHLQGCRWHQALREIRTLPPNRQTVFLATLTALISRKVPEKKAEKLSSSSPVYWPTRVSGLEVWRDEWDELEVESLCQSKKQPMREEKREKLRELSREYFSKFSKQEWEKDFLLVGLAFDVNAEVPHEHLLNHYQEFQGTPLYKRLEMLAPEKEKVSITQGADEIELGTVVFSETIHQLKASPVPWLVENR